MGCTLGDLQRLQHYLDRLSKATGNLQDAWLSPLALSSLTMLAGPSRLSGLEARSEIVRRAIEYLERL
jgi:hypothetical protein